ncbi:MAG: hypothetical protein HC817_02180 [Saprospiraceae bacterium]|nr:hypothetical protein [Saprospiraceae bacterium]
MSQLPPQSLTNTQLTLLKMFAYQLPEEELEEMKAVLARFFAQRIRKRTAQIWEERQYSNDTMQTWLNEEGQ